MELRFVHYIHGLVLGLFLGGISAHAAPDCADCSPSRIGLAVTAPLGAECQLPLPGETRDHSPVVVFGFPASNSYRITRLPNREGKPQLEASIKINFTAEPQLAQAMREKVQFCYAALSPALQGPEGEQLTLKLADESAPLQAASVRVNGCFLQESSDCYSMHSECSVIVHEALHLLGLVDEYAHKDFDCRSVGSRPSMMNDEIPYVDQALNHCEQVGCLAKVQGSDRARVIAELSESLQKSSPDCQSKTGAKSTFLKTLKEWNRNLIPHWKFVMEHPGARDLPGSQFVQRSESIGKKCDPTPLVSDFGDGYVLVSSPKRDLAPKIKGSLLLPTQFYKIVYPTCKALNSLYDECMKNAYRAQQREGCLPVAPACVNGNWLNQL